MTTTAAPKQQKTRSLAGRTTTPQVPATLREMEDLSSDLCEQVELLQGLCRTLGVFAYAEDLEGPTNLRKINRMILRERPMSNKDYQ